MSYLAAIYAVFRVTVQLIAGASPNRTSQQCDTCRLALGEFLRSLKRALTDAMSGSLWFVNWRLKFRVAIVRQFLGGSWKELAALLACWKASLHRWRAKLLCLGKQTGMAFLAMLVLMSSFLAGQQDPQVSFSLTKWVLLAAVCFAFSWFLAGLFLNSAPALARAIRSVCLA